MKRLSTLSGAVRRETGLTLVELMIALVLGLFVLGAAIALMLSSKAGYLAQDDEARLRDTGRYVIENISRAIRQAAFENWDTAEAPIVATPVLSANVGGLDARSLKKGSPGMEAVVAKSINGSDVLALRYFGSGRDIADNTMINCAGFGVPAPASKDSAEQDRGWSIYFVADNSDGEPELNCSYLGKSGWKSDAIASGVESFQVLYGIDTDQDGLANQLMTATEIDLLDKALILEGVNAKDQALDLNRKTNWKKVVLVKVALLVRGTEKTQKSAISSQYDLFGKEYADANASKDKGVRIVLSDLPKTDRDKARKIFTATIQLRNKSAGSGT